MIACKHYIIEHISRLNMTTKPIIEMIELCKSRAARLAVDENIKANCVIGIGSGSTMRYVLERLKQKCEEDGILVKCIPTSFQSKELIYKYGMPITELDANPNIDVTIDGADEVDSNFVAIKGGGACLTQEKVIAFAAKKFVIVADYRKNSINLGENWTKGIPIEVLPMACNSVRHYICEKYDADLSDIKTRIGVEKAGPVITDNGNFIIDWKLDFRLYRSLSDLSKLSDEIKLIPGIIETGIFAGMADSAYFGKENGDIIKRERMSNQTTLYQLMANGTSKDTYKKSDCY